MRAGARASREIHFSGRPRQTRGGGRKGASSCSRRDQRSCVRAVSAPSGKVYLFALRESYRRKQPASIQCIRAGSTFRARVPFPRFLREIHPLPSPPPPPFAFPRVLYPLVSARPPFPHRHIVCIFPSLVSTSARGAPFETLRARARSQQFLLARSRINDSTRI